MNWIRSPTEFLIPGYFEFYDVLYEITAICPTGTFMAYMQDLVPIRQNPIEIIEISDDEPEIIEISDDESEDDIAPSYDLWSPNMSDVEYSDHPEIYLNPLRKK